ncbi:MAG: O-antigen ligase family protein [bacterium]
MREKYFDSILNTILLLGLIFIILLQATILRFMPLLNPDIGIYMVLRSSWADDIIKIFILFVIAIFIIKQFFQKNDVIYLGNMDALVGLFFLVCMVSLVYSINFNYTFRALSTLFCYICFFYGIVWMVTKDIFFEEKIVEWFIIAALIVSIYGIFQRFFLFGYMEAAVPLKSLWIGKKMIKLRRVGSFFGWPNILASFLGLAIPVTLGYLMSIKQRSTRLFCLLSLLTMILCMVLTYSITGWMSLSIGLFLEIILIWRYYDTNKQEVGEDTDKDKRRSKKEKTFIIIIITFIIFISLCFIAKKRAATRRLTNASARARIGYLKGTLNIIRENLFLGTGLNTFRIAYLKHAPEGKLFETRYAHNTYLEMVSELGPLGLFFFCAFFLSLLVQGFGLLTIQKSDDSKYMTIGLLSGIITYLIGDLGNYAMQIQKTNLYFWLIMAILAGMILRNASKSNVENRSVIIKGRYRQALLVAVVFLMVINLYLVRGQLFGDIYFYQGIKHLMASESDAGIANLDKAKKYNKYDHRYYCTTGEALLEIAKNNSWEGQKNIDAAIENYQEAIAHNPHSGPIYAILGDIYYRNKNDRNTAFDYYQKAILYHTSNMRIYEQKIENLGIN